MKRSLYFVLFALITAAVPVRAATVEPIVTEAIVNAPVDEVWKLWTTKAGIESWMVAKTDIDLKVGGIWRTSYSTASNLDDDAAIHQLILGYDPARMLSIRVVKYPKNFPFPNAVSKAWTVIYFEGLSEARTRITVRMLGFSEDDESQKMRAFFETGNKTTLDALVKRLEKR